MDSWLAVVASMAQAATKAALAAKGFEPVYRPPVEVSRLIDDELSHMRALAHRAHRLHASRRQVLTR